MNPSIRTLAVPVLAAAVTVTGSLLPDADAARLAEPGCFTHEVTRGDTLSSIARNYDTTLDALRDLNPQLAVPSFDLIYPGDQVAIVCLGDAAPPPRVEHVDVSRWIGRWESDRTMSWEWVIAELYRAGFRGDDLVTAAAIAPGESGRSPFAVGDTHLENATWGSSYGFMQVRALRAQQGTGGPRDADALWENPEHQAWAAFEVYRSAGGFKPWSAWLKGMHKPYMDHARAVAESMGVL